MVFAKVEPFLAQLREKFENPEAFKNLEKVILDSPNGKEKLAKTQEWLKMINEQIAAAQAGGKAGEASA